MLHHHQLVVDDPFCIAQEDVLLSGVPWTIKLHQHPCATLFTIHGAPLGSMRPCACYTHQRWINHPMKGNFRGELSEKGGGPSCLCSCQQKGGYCREPCQPSVPPCKPRRSSKSHTPSTASPTPLLSMATHYLLHMLPEICGTNNLAMSACTAT